MYEIKRHFIDTLDSCKDTLIRFVDIATKRVYQQNVSIGLVTQNSNAMLCVNLGRYILVDTLKIHVY